MLLFSDNQIRTPYTEWLRDGPDETRQPVAWRQWCQFPQRSPALKYEVEVGLPSLLPHSVRDGRLFLSISSSSAAFLSIGKTQKGWRTCCNRERDSLPPSPSRRDTPTRSATRSPTRSWTRTWPRTPWPASPARRSPRPTSCWSWAKSPPRPMWTTRRSSARPSPTSATATAPAALTPRLAA